MARALLETVPRGNFAEGGDYLLGVSLARAVIANSQVISKRAYDAIWAALHL